MPGNSETVLAALKDRYIRQPSTDVNTGQEALIEFLRAIPDDMLIGGGLLADLIVTQHPDWRLSDDDKAMLIAIDDCNKLIFRLSDLETEAEQRLFEIIPELACQLMLSPDMPVDLPDFSILEVLDLMVNCTVGWSDNLGRSGEQLMKKLDEVVVTVREEGTDYEDLEKDLQVFLDKEHARVKKLEERLTASETGQLRSQRGKIQAAQMINAKMQGQRLTETIISFLQGPWFDSIQLLLLTKGFDGDEWSRAEKLTETIIWTYQPIGAAPLTDESVAVDDVDEVAQEAEAISVEAELESEGISVEAEQDSDDQASNDAVNIQAETQRLYRIIEHLPSEIRELLVALERTSSIAEAAIESIESEHIQIISGGELEFVEDIRPIEIDQEVFNQTTSVSRILLRKVNNLEPGQWFTFEEDNVCIRIKLVLKLKDVKQLLFTNRNGMKALQKSFDEMAYLLSSGVIKPLNHQDVFSSAYANYYNGIVKSFEERTKRAADEVQESKKDAADKEATKDKAIAEAKALAIAKEEAELIRQEEEKEARLARARTEAGKEENVERVKELTLIVHGLNIGARLQLPNSIGSPEECTLAVKLAAADKMIFVSRTGVKLGEYNTEQLVQLLLVGDAEIQEAGVEFQDTLAQVVTKLRVDRDKSYDDLTGS
jgi:hypothetical protein